MAGILPPDYSPLVVELLARQRLMELGPGEPDDEGGNRLRSLAPEQLLAPHSIRDRTMARCCLAGLWLYFDWLDQSHAISQEVHTTTGSYWHGILHRREPDYSNAKYWFHRVGRHPVFTPLAAAAREVVAAQPDSDPGRFLAGQAEWDPYRFVDLCAAAERDGGASRELCRQVQQAEWQLLFDHCYALAVGAPTASTG